MSAKWAFFTIAALAFPAQATSRTADQPSDEWTVKINNSGTDSSFCSMTKTNTVSPKYWIELNDVYRKFVLSAKSLNLEIGKSYHFKINGIGNGSSLKDAEVRDANTVSADMTLDELIDLTSIQLAVIDIAGKIFSLRMNDAGKALEATAKCWDNRGAE